MPTSNEQHPAVRAEIEQALQLEKNGNLQAALQLLDRTCTEHPELGEAWLEHALLLDKHDQESDAIPKYRQAMQCGLTADQERTALICLASSYRNVGEMQKALDTIEEANTRFPQHAVVESFYALILHDSGQTEKALSTLGCTLLREARSGALAGFEGALDTKFHEVLKRSAEKSSI